MTYLPIFLKRVLFFGKVACSFLLSIAIFGCLLIPSPNTQSLIVKASQEAPIIVNQPTILDPKINLDSFSFPLTLDKDTQEFSIPYTSTIDTPAPTPSIPKPAKPIEITDKPIPNTPPVAPTPPTPLKNLSLTIPKIGLKSINLVYGTNRNIPEIDRFLINNPVIETQDALNICSESGNSYIFGHSEPPDTINPGSAGRIFGSLHTLNAGDTIELVTAEGKPCKYKVDKWDQMVVDKEGNIDINEYYRAMQYPDKPSASSLTIQTCKKGSTTVRLLLRASRID